MIVAHAVASTPIRPVNVSPFTGYSWNGSGWTENPALINGLSSSAGIGGDNFATLTYNLIGDGKWDLIDFCIGDNINNCQGFEWIGNSWVQSNSLVIGLTKISSENKFGIPCIASNFEGDTVLFVGLSSGGSPTGSVESFIWTESGWTFDNTLVYGVSNLLPWPNSPTVAYNVLGDNKWILLIGSSSGTVNQTDYYKAYGWTGRNTGSNIVSLTPLSITINATEYPTFTATIAGNTPPYTYEWYVNDQLKLRDVTYSNTYSFTPILAANTTSYIYVNIADANGLTASSQKATAIVSGRGGMPVLQNPANGTVPALLVSYTVSTQNASLDVNIKGNLTYNGAALPDSPITLAYSADGGNNWIYLTSSRTDTNGNFVFDWLPSTNDNYLLKVEYPGNGTYSQTNTVINLENTPSAINQQAFSIQTNSTISALFFNSTASQLSFTVSGPKGTTGFIDMYIEKSMVPDISTLQVLLDGRPLNYTTQSADNSWLLSFVYHHSMHSVSISFSSNSGKQTSNLPTDFQNLILAIIIASIIAFAIVLAYSLKKKSLN